MVQVAPFASGRCAAGAAEFTVDGNEIHERSACAELYEPDIILAPLDAAAEYVTIELEHAIEIAHTKHDMVDLPDANAHSPIPTGAARTVASSAHRWRTVLRAHT